MTDLERVAITGFVVGLSFWGAWLSSVLALG
jgi:hypothetical protein